jgi:serine protease Do
VAERARPAVVHVRGIQSAGGETGGGGRATGGSQVSVGTGFIVHRAGYIVTNEHVVRDSADLRVRLYDGRELPACVVGADLPTDIALLKVEAPMSLPVLALGDSDAVRVGEPVLAIGNPYGFDQSVTAGIVSATKRVIYGPASADNTRPCSLFIQTDASINVGNSGGPLIDSAGAVIGVNSAFLGGQPLQPAQGIGFAIPINMAKSLLPQLRAEGAAPRSLLGVDAQPLDSALAVAWKLPSTLGALIAWVQPNSPAEAGGLEPGDVVTAWNGIAVSSDEDLKIRAQRTPPGTRVSLTLVRGGRRQQRSVTTQAAPSGPPAAAHPAACGRARPVRSGDGFEVAPVPPDAAAHLPGGRGVAVSSVVPGSPANEAGLSPGDVILRIGGTAVRTPEDLHRALAATASGATLPILVRHGGFDFWTALTHR